MTKKNRFSYICKKLNNKFVKLCSDSVLSTYDNGQITYKKNEVLYITNIFLSDRSHGYDIPHYYVHLLDSNFRKTYVFTFYESLFSLSGYFKILI